MWLVAACVAAGAAPSGLADDLTAKGFMPRQADSAVSDLAAEFAAERDRGSWEKAFATLARFADAGADRLAPAGDGLWLPCPAMVQSLLIQLPEKGRQAYRLFYDAKARQLFDIAMTENLDDNREAAALEVLVRQYLITSVGPRAADRLGDLHFSRGEFAQAEKCWRLILTQCPDADLSILRLQLKRATALARLGRWEELKNVREAVAQRAGEGGVVLGGRKVNPTEYLATLPTAATPAASRPSPAAEFALPETDAALWQTPVATPKLRERVNHRLGNWGGQMMNITSAAPVSAVDDQRVYVNWLGACFALDAQTGKILWQTRGDETWSEQDILRLASADTQQFTISKQEDKLLVTAPQLGRGGVGGGMLHSAVALSRLDPQNGWVLWTTADNTLSTWSFLGNQLVVGDVIYASARDALKQNMSLLAIAAESGALLWSVPLGAPESLQTMRGTTVNPPPLVMQSGDEVLLLTNGGMAMAVDPVARAVTWALSYEPPERIPTDPWNRRMMSSPPAVSAEIDNDQLWIKDGDGAGLWCLSLAGPERTWRRPVTAGSSFVGMDGQQFYLLGESLDAIERQSRDLAWSTPIPAGTGSVLLTRDHLFAFTTRGICQVRKSDGTVARLFRGADMGNGGDLRRIGDRLIAISAFNITAYALKSTPATRP